MRRLAFSAPLALALTVPWGTRDAMAESTKGRWHLGGGAAWVSTVDDIRSNAAFVLFDQPGPDGVPDSGDETILFADPRPDDTLSRETTLDEGIRFDFNASYGVTEWMSIVLETSWYEADLVQLDTYVEQSTWVDFNLDRILDPNVDVDTLEQSQPISGGSITQIPIGFTLQFRFLRDSPINPYIGAGAGYVLIDTQESDALNAINDTLSTQPISTIGTNNYPAYILCQGSVGASQTPCPRFEGYALDVDDSTEWHLAGGIEYFFNSKLAFYFDARYTWVREPIEVRATFDAAPGTVDVNGQDQLAYAYDAVADTLLYCDDDLFDGYFAENAPTFNRDLFGLTGIFDMDYPNLPTECRPGDGMRLQDTILVQGGKLDLSAYVFGFGIRWFF